MRKLVAAVVYVLVVVVTVTAQESAPVVETAQGKLRGKILHTYTGKEILSYIGVRFAEPPTGENRFKAPVPLKSWGGVKNVTEDGPLCVQFVSQGTVTSEDCLFLNVHTKKLNGRAPVIIYLHPGGFTGGNGNNLFTGPQYFLDKNIVLVTINYRLGPFGFLSTGDSVIPGNFGLLDQLEAMKWVKQNIAKFGGDPNSVTLFGYSAGAGSVQLHMASPLSAGLFHKAISSSYSATSPAGLIKDPTSLSRRFAKLLNCKTESSQQIRDCLMRLPAQDILAATSKIWDTLQPPFSLFAPVIEKEGGDKRFLRDDPVKIFQSGHFNHVPLITGVTRGEFNWRAQFLLTNETYTNRINSEFDEIAPWEFHYPREPRELSKRISTAFKHLYLHDQPVNNETEKGIGDLYADSRVTFSVVQAAKLLAEKNRFPVYFYFFTFEGRYSYRYKLGTNIPYDVGHHDDLIYLFYNSPRFPLFNQTDPEAYMVRTLTHVYAEFAKTGTPTLPETSARWSPLSKQHRRYLELTRGPTMKEGLPYPDRMAVWESLLPLDKPYRQIYY